MLLLGGIGLQGRCQLFTLLAFLQLPQHWPIHRGVAGGWMAAQLGILRLLTLLESLQGSVSPGLHGSWTSRRWGGHCCGWSRDQKG